METKGDIREAPAPGGFGVPTEALAKLQTDYMAGAVEVWNRILQPAEAPKRPADRRFAASDPDGGGHPPGDPVAPVGKEP